MRAALRVLIVIVATLASMAACAVLVSIYVLALIG